MSIPILGSLSVNASRQVVIPVADMGGNAQVRAEYAVVTAGSPPPSTSLGWIVADVLTASPGEATTLPQLYTATVWVRLVGLTTDGELATPYTVPVSIEIDDIARFVSYQATLDARVPVLLWQANSLTAGVRVSWEVHNAGEDPGTLANVVDVDADDGGYTVVDVLQTGEAITITAEAWTGYTSAVVSGDAGQLVADTLLADPSPPAGQLYVAESDGASISIGSTSEYYELETPVWTLADWASLFDESAGNGRLTYIGAEPETMLITGYFSASVGVANQMVHVVIGINGDPHPASEAHFQFITVSAINAGSVGLIHRLVYGDYVSLMIRNATATNSIDIAVASLIAVAVG